MDGGDVIILGAGFSKAIFPEMPTLDELGTLSIKRAGLTDDPLIPILSSPSGFTFETWLATLAEPQPYLSEADNATNHALFGTAEGSIVILSTKSTAVPSAVSKSSNGPHTTAAI